jgi:hypothetical protein
LRSVLWTRGEGRKRTFFERHTVSVAVYPLQVGCVHSRVSMNVNGHSSTAATRRYEAEKLQKVARKIKFVYND